jgi:hypothetical protein
VLVVGSWLCRQRRHKHKHKHNHHHDNHIQNDSRDRSLLARLPKTQAPRPCPDLITSSSLVSCGGRLSRFSIAEQTLAAVTAAVFQPLLHGDGGPYAAPPARRSYGRKTADLHQGGAFVSSTLPTRCSAGVARGHGS